MGKAAQWFLFCVPDGVSVGQYSKVPPPWSAIMDACPKPERLIMPVSVSIESKGACGPVMASRETFTLSSCERSCAIGWTSRERERRVLCALQSVRIAGGTLALRSRALQSSEHAGVGASTRVNTSVCTMAQVRDALCSPLLQRSPTSAAAGAVKLPVSPKARAPGVILGRKG